MLTEIGSVKEHDEIVSGNGPVVIEYAATWCGPCKVVKAHMERMTDHTDIPLYVFYVDTAEGGDEITGRYEITTVPRIMKWQAGNPQELQGRNAMALLSELGE